MRSKAKIAASTPSREVPKAAASHPVRRVLVAVDSASSSDAALALGIRLATSVNGVLRVVHLRMWDPVGRGGGRAFLETTEHATLALTEALELSWARELEASGLVEARPGRGTFITSTLAAPSLKHHEALRHELESWLEAAERAGLDEESIRAVISTTLREAFVRRVA